MSGKKAKGKRAKTRSKFKRKKGKVAVNKMLQELKPGTKVQINIDSSIHSAMPSSRYQGFTGIVSGKRGAAFEVELSHGGKEKSLIVHPAHLNILQEKEAR